MTVPAGATSAAFTARTSIVVISTTVTISGSYNNTTQSAKLNVSTFSSPQNISNDQDASTAPTIAVDSGANVYLIWQDRGPLNMSPPVGNIFFSRGISLFPVTLGLVAGQIP